MLVRVCTAVYHMTRTGERHKYNRVQERNRKELITPKGGIKRRIITTDARRKHIPV